MLPVIDLFAGPGGLREGFASVGWAPPTKPTPTSTTAGGHSPPYASPRPSRFRVALSIEKDPAARETLRLRAFYRQFPPSAVPEQYYDFLRGDMDLNGRKAEGGKPKAGVDSSPG